MVFLLITPQVTVVGSGGFDSRTLLELAEVVEKNIELIERSWHEHFR